MTVDFRSASKLSTRDLEINKVLRNTYFLLSLTLMFSALVAFLTMISNVAPPNFIIVIIGMFGLSYLTSIYSNSSIGLLCVFAFTGFMGYVLGPILNMYLHGFSNGAELIMTAFGSTGVIFLALSSYVLTTRKNFSYMGGFLFAAIMVAFILGILSAFFQMPILNLVISGAFALISSGLILYHTSEIIHGGQRNYIIATISIYTALFNLFLSLLRIFAAFAGNRD